MSQRICNGGFSDVREKGARSFGVLENLPSAGFLCVYVFVKNATRCSGKYTMELVNIYRKLSKIPVYYIKSK